MISYGSLIGKGNTADAYECEDGKMLKLFHEGYSENTVKYEAHCTELISQFKDIRMPGFYGFVEENGQFGLVFDRINGENLQKRLMKSGDVDGCNSILAQMHEQILSHSCPQARSCKEILKRHIHVSECVSEAMCNEYHALLDSMPDSDTLCHGDFHYGNILMQEDTPYVIDFANVCRGDRTFDIARTFYLIGMTPPPEGVPNPQEFMSLKMMLANDYLERMHSSKSEIQDWIKIVAISRLAELDRPKHQAEKKLVLSYLA